MIVETKVVVEFLLVIPTSSGSSGASITGVTTAGIVIGQSVSGTGVATGAEVVIDGEVGVAIGHTETLVEPYVTNIVMDMQ